MIILLYFTYIFKGRRINEQYITRIEISLEKFQHMLISLFNSSKDGMNTLLFISRDEYSNCIFLIVFFIITLLEKLYWVVRKVLSVILL